ncbi:C-type lectin 37Db-like [Drosophila takahashii]|uniref:C-type lectin 37Db-like n=1 Tax=Drosophila takahashii TaxID=29030 RepID=UPI001CF80E17|nr:C-type lectin 37Db-like [Drosophila takahashii]
MLKLGIYLSVALFACTLFVVQAKSLQDDNKERLKRIEDQQADIHQSELGTYSEFSTKASWPNFKQIGSRYFYIDSSSKYTWEEAVSACRDLGGCIAAIKDQEELDAIAEELDAKRYWLGINDRTRWGDYVSEASGKKAFLKWQRAEPNNEGNNERCIELLNAEMNDLPCSYKLNIICQADNNV